MRLFLFAVFAKSKKHKYPQTALNSGNGNFNLLINMKQFSFLSTMALACLLLASCQKEAQMNFPSEDEVKQPTVITLPEISMRATAGTAEIAVPKGCEVVVPPSASWIREDVPQTRSTLEAGKQTIGVTENTTGMERKTELQIREKSSGRIMGSVVLRQSDLRLLAGDILIEEVFYTSTVFGNTGRPDKRHGDQYFKLINTKELPLDISGLMIMEAKVNSAIDAQYDATYNTHACVQTVYCIPAGTTLEANESIVIANNAQNHTLTNPNSFDLSNARFEWFDQSQVPAMQDIDNPNVDNLDIWYTYSKSLWVLNDRGLYGYAIAMPPAGVTKENFLANYKWEGQYQLHLPNGSWHTANISHAYKVPNAWVIDAVNLGVSAVWKVNSFNSILDQGYSYCGAMNNDPNRYGKSVIRKNIDEVWMDTNNSSNDFTPNVTASMLLP